MSPRQTRRSFLLGTGTVAATGLSGCSRTVESGPGARNTTATGTKGSVPVQVTRGEVPSWAGWVPASLVVSDPGNAFAVGVQEARAELPTEIYQEIGVQQAAARFGISQSDIDYFGGTRVADSRGIRFLTGSFDPDAILESLDAQEGETTQSHGYSLVDGVAVGPDAVITGSAREGLDARFGSVTSLEAAGEDWRELLSVVGAGTVAGVEGGGFPHGSLPFTVPRSGVELDPSRVLVTGYLMFDTANRANEVLENNEDEIRTEVEEQGGTVETIGQVDRWVVLSFIPENFSF